MLQLPTARVVRFRNSNCVSAPMDTLAQGGAPHAFTFQTHPWMRNAADVSCRGIMVFHQGPQPSFNFPAK